MPHFARVLARGEQRGLVDEVRKIGAGKSRRAARDRQRLDVARDRHLAHVHFQDLLAAAQIRQRHDDLAIETARTQQRRIEHVRAVRRGDDDDAFVAFEAVHLDEQLIQRLLALVVTAAETGAAMAADRVDLVDEDDARRVLLRLLEHVAHARGADADEHLDEIGTGDREERHLRFAGDRFREQRLAGAGRADHQHAARNLAAELGELGRIAQELDELADFLLGLVATGDVGERDLDLILALQLRARTPERHRAASARAGLHLAHEIDEQADEDQERNPVEQDAPERHHVVRRRLPHFDVVLVDELERALSCRPSESSSTPTSHP